MNSVALSMTPDVNFPNRTNKNQTSLNITTLCDRKKQN